MKKYLIVIILLAGFSLAHADPKPKVEIVFRIEDPLYKLHFDSELATLQSNVASQLKGVFNTYLSFIEFTDEHAEDKLIITLHNVFKNNADISTPKDLVFFFGFEGPNVKSGIPPMHWLYQTKVKYGETPFSSGDFTNSIVSRIKERLSQEYEILVESIFSKFVLTKEAHLISALSGWALPFHSNDLGISNNTQFEIEIEKETGFGPATCEYPTKVHILQIAPQANVPDKFKGCFIIRNTSQQDNCGVFSTTLDSIKINEVTMLFYNREDLPEDNVVPPDNFVPDL